MRRRVAALGLAVAAAAAGGIWWWQAAGAPAGADAGDAQLVALGRTIYERHCASCHGAHLEGQKNWRERLPNGRLPAPPHNADGHTWHHPDAQLFEITKRGAANIAPGYQSDMPSFAAVLSDREIWAVLAFIKSTWPPEIQARQARLNR
jgi:mono/diheme cytochrome c family protein